MKARAAMCPNCKNIISTLTKEGTCLYCNIQLYRNHLGDLVLKEPINKWNELRGYIRDLIPVYEKYGLSTSDFSEILSKMRRLDDLEAEGKLKEED